MRLLGCALSLAIAILAGCGGGPADELCSPSERCGDGVDNDCDDEIDEGCACTPGTIQACGAGVCAGEQQCEAGVWGPCFGGAPSAEVCDGVDNDCDDVVDDGDGGCGGVCELANTPGVACDGDDADACAEGAWTCLGPNLVGCTDTTGSTFELCGDGVDNNCDDRADEYCAGATLRWIDHGGSPDFGARAKAMAAAVAPDGSIYVVGYHDRSIQFGGGAASWDAGGRTDGFLVKYTGAGALVWHRPISGPGDERLTAVALDPDGTIVVAGEFGDVPAPNSLELGPGVVLTPRGGIDAFVARYTSAGGFVAALQLGSDGDDGIGGVAVGATGKVAVTGRFLGDELHVGDLVVPRTGTYRAFFVAATSPGLAPAWARRVELGAGGSGPIEGTSVGFAADGDVYVGGSVACYVGCDAATLVVNRGEPDELVIPIPGTGFVAKLGPAGALRWARAPAHVDGLAVDPDGVYVTGAFAGTVVFAVGEPNQTAIASAGTTDGWLGRYDAAGGFAWARRFGSDVACPFGAAGDVARDVAIGPAGDPVVVGAHNGTLDFDGELALAGDGWGNVFWAGYTAAGALGWAHNGKIGELPCAGGGDAAGVAIAPNGDMVVVGNFVGHLILPSETVVAPSELFIAVFAP